MSGGDCLDDFHRAGKFRPLSTASLPAWDPEVCKERKGLHSSVHASHSAFQLWKWCDQLLQSLRPQLPTLTDWALRPRAQTNPVVTFVWMFLITVKDETKAEVGPEKWGLCCSYHRQRNAELCRLTRAKAQLHNQKISLRNPWELDIKGGQILGELFEQRQRRSQWRS